jgi:acyl-CoA dehydrogenase
MREPVVARGTGALPCPPPASSPKPAADAGRWSALCKLVARDAATAVTTDAVQVLGGHGYLDDHPGERMMRGAKIALLYEGTQQIQRLVIARARLVRAR